MISSLKVLTLVLASIFGDHMVLQQGQPVRVWGWDRPGTSVSVSMQGFSAQALAGQDGRWEAELPAFKAGGPYELKVQGSKEVVLRDVLVGELWVAAGQSNMQMELGNTTHGAEDIASADLPQIRLFQVRKNEGPEPLDEVYGQWAVCSPSAVKTFSAVAFLAARRMQKELKVPVGVIQASWQGSLIQSWIPEPVLRSEAGLVAIDAKLKGHIQQWDATPAAERETLLTGVPFQAEFRNVKVGGRPVRLDNSNWYPCNDHVQVSSAQGTGRLEGKSQTQGWLYAGLTLGRSDLRDNGMLEFEVRGNGHFTIAVAVDAVKDWDLHHSQPGFVATPQWSKVRVDLAQLKQDGWGAPQPMDLSKVKELMFRHEMGSFPKRPGGLYNAMVAPYSKLRARGVMWYQGEGNSVSCESGYDKFLTAMIKAWRAAWGLPLDFAIVQLPNYQERMEDPWVSIWACTREMQLRVSQTVPGTVMSVNIEQGEVDVHPHNKSVVGERLALAILGKLYKRPLTWSGPVFLKAEPKGGTLVVHFNPMAKRLTSLRPGQLKGFAIAGEDQDFNWANAKIVGNSVVLSSPKVPKPRWVRYAWAQNPEADLANDAGLPASPFRNDAF